MTNSATDVLLSFPPRPIGEMERTLFNEWLSRAGDITLVYISDRRSDDPRFYRRIIIWPDPDKKLVYTVHSAASAWLVSSTEQTGKVFRDRSHYEAYATLRDALNSIRAVLV